MKIDDGVIIIVYYLIFVLTCTLLKLKIFWCYYVYYLKNVNHFTDCMNTSHKVYFVFKNELVISTYHFLNKKAIQSCI